jgi:hypothetical protein
MNLWISVTNSHRDSDKDKYADEEFLPLICMSGNEYAKGMLKSCLKLGLSGQSVLLDHISPMTIQTGEQCFLLSGRHTSAITALQRENNSVAGIIGVLQLLSKGREILGFLNKPYFDEGHLATCKPGGPSLAQVSLEYHLHKVAFHLDCGLGERL